MQEDCQAGYQTRSQRPSWCQSSKNQISPHAQGINDEENRTDGTTADDGADHGPRYSVCGIARFFRDGHAAIKTAYTLD